MGKSGNILKLWAPARCFTEQQRKAIALRDGGCATPGCTAPMRWVEEHEGAVWCSVPR